MTEILVLVHPGSACGSADMNIGRPEARSAREALCAELDGWKGGVIVIDGELSDELPGYPGLDLAISTALAHAVANGQISQRVMGDDPEQNQRIREIVTEMGDAAKFMDFTVSGAWYHPDDRSGCVGGVWDVLSEMGCKANVSDACVKLFEGDVEIFPSDL